MSRKTTFLVALIVVLAMGAEYVVLTQLIPPEPRAVIVEVTPTLGEETTASAPAAALGSATASAPTAPSVEVPLLASASYTLPVAMGDLGPRLVEAGAIDLDRFIELYERRGTPLTPEQEALLREGSDEPLVVNPENAHFLLNLLWGLGLTNKNPILTKGPMVTYGDGEVGNYASTGGWTIGTSTAVVLYASENLIELTEEQQERLRTVARNVYRPCCNNPTDFPDCNHGMAMLGLLEMMAATDATEEEMFEAAKAINTVWFPGQTQAQALYMKHALDTGWENADPETVVGTEVASGSGFRNVHEWLSTRGLLPTAPGGGSGCGL